MNRELARENWDAWSSEFMEIWYSGNYFAPISALEPLNSSFTLKFVRSLTWGNMTPELWRLWTRIKFPFHVLVQMCVSKRRDNFENTLWLECSRKDGASDSRIRSFGTVLCFLLFFSFSFFPVFFFFARRTSVFRNWELICVARTFFPRWRKEKNIPTLLSQMMCGLRDKGQKLF